jgi:hypothetical protein
MGLLDKTRIADFSVLPKERKNCRAQAKAAVGTEMQLAGSKRAPWL